jgi:hypothetical protein
MQGHRETPSVKMELAGGPRFHGQRPRDEHDERGLPVVACGAGGVRASEVARGGRRVTGSQRRREEQEKVRHSMVATVGATWQPARWIDAGIGSGPVAVHTPLPVAR